MPHERVALVHKDSAVVYDVEASYLLEEEQDSKKEEAEQASVSRVVSKQPPTPPARLLRPAACKEYKLAREAAAAKDEEKQEDETARQEQVVVHHERGRALLCAAATARMAPAGEEDEQVRELPQHQEQHPATHSGYLTVWQNGEVHWLAADDANVLVESDDAQAMPGPAVPEGVSLPSARKDESLPSSSHFSLTSLRVPLSNVQLVEAIPLMPSLPGVAGPSAGRPPRRVDLSSDHSRLLVLGARVHGVSSVVVYDIRARKLRGCDQPQVFLTTRYVDMMAGYIDACFSPDGDNLAAIPALHPSFIWLISLDPSAVVADQRSPSQGIRVRAKRQIQGVRATGLLYPYGQVQYRAEEHAKTINTYPMRQRSSCIRSSTQLQHSAEPIPVGPISVVGPVRTASTGNAVGTISRIVCNPGRAGCWQRHMFGHVSGRINTHGVLDDPPDVGAETNCWDFVTWPDTGASEYHLWSMIPSANTYATDGLTQKSSPDGSVCLAALCLPRFLLPSVYSDVLPDQVASGVRVYIEAAAFSPVTARLAFLTCREAWSKSQDNGLGIELVPTLARHSGKGSVDKSGATQLASLAQGVVFATEPRANWCVVSRQMTRRKLRGIGYHFAWVPSMAQAARPAVALTLPGEGITEVFDMSIAATFLAAHKPSTVADTASALAADTASAAVRVAADSSGSLTLIAAAPGDSSPRLCAWSDFPLLEPETAAGHRAVAAQLGYTVRLFNVPDEDSFAAGKKKQPRARGFITLAETTAGLHMCRCDSCRRCLIQPQVCSGCREAVYCSPECLRLSHECSSVQRATGEE